MSTIDTTKPNISRVYDYMLGGHHNFEVDRAMAQQLLKVFPSYPVWARLNRWFLQKVAQDWHTQGHKYVLDLGSGMPTQDHFHVSIPDARVLYSDNDPIAVAYAQEVIKNHTHVKYIEGDVRMMSPILEAADEHFEGERQIALGCIGISYFLDDTTVEEMMSATHEWAAPGSVMAITFAYSTGDPAAIEEILAVFRKTGNAPITRTPDQLAALATPWKVREVHPLNEWLGVEKQIDPNDIIGNAAEMYGAILDH